MAKVLNWKYFEQRLKTKNIFLFTLGDIQRIFRVSKVSATFFLYRYTKQKFLKRLKRGLYIFSEVSIPDLYIANKLYEPSYISLQFALSYHQVIPETVYEITSVTSKATRLFSALGKIFSYRRIKRSAFTGYSPLRQRGYTFFLAEPEKAFVDLAYLHIICHQKPLDRFHKEKLNLKKIFSYAELFHNKKLTHFIKTLFS